MTVEMLCDCTHRKWGHAGGTYACWDCGCKRYTPDIQKAARDHAEGESTSARLRRVERELIALQAEKQAWRDFGYKVAAKRDLALAELASAKTELELLRAARQEATDA